MAPRPADSVRQLDKAGILRPDMMTKEGSIRTVP